MYDSEPNNKIESRIVDFIKEFEEIKPPVKEEPKPGIYKDMDFNKSILYLLRML
jgi:hypothetical protein